MYKTSINKKSRVYKTTICINKKSRVFIDDGEENGDEETIKSGFKEIEIVFKKIDDHKFFKKILLTTTIRILNLGCCEIFQKKKSVRFLNDNVLYVLFNKNGETVGYDFTIQHFENYTFQFKILDVVEDDGNNYLIKIKQDDIFLYAYDIFKFNVAPSLVKHACTT